MIKLVCPAGNLPSLKNAIDYGADAVYIGFQDDTNARHFAGLNFNPQRAAEGIAYAHRHHKQVYVAINTYPQPDGWPRWQQAVDQAAQLGVDALIIADVGVMAYAAERWPALPLHLSVQGSATTVAALRFYQQHFKIQRAVIPRVLSLQQLTHLATVSPVPLEVFGFGSLCIMVEGRCLLSSFVTGQSPNTFGACSPATAVRWQTTPHGLETRLNQILIDRRHPDSPAGYPVLCKGHFKVNDKLYYALEEPTSLNTLDILPQLQAIGIAAIKIEGRQRSPAYVKQVTQVWRAALNACQQNPKTYSPRPEWQQVLMGVAEGTQTTLGAIHRPWQ